MFTGNANEILYLRQEADRRYMRRYEGESIESDVADLRKRIEGLQGGSFEFETDETLVLKDGVLGVNTAEAVEKDNTLPITSSAVFTEIGNINALLATI